MIEPGQRFTNLGHISLPMAVWLADDDYDFVARPKAVSATSLLKPIKSLVLGQKVIELGAQSLQDLVDVIPSRLGTALHTAVETSWLTDRYKTAMVKLGYPQHVIDNVCVNPPRDRVDPKRYNVFLELRTEKEIDGWTISGKFDFVENGRVKDVKSTGTYNWIHGGNDEKYAMQGAIYKWLNPDLITDDVMDIEFFFTDWKALVAMTDKKYPQKRVETRTLRLKSPPEIEHFIKSKLSLLTKMLPLKEVDMPQCTPEEVWQKPTKWAYYKNPKSLTRATKVFDTEMAATDRLHKDGSVGIIQKRPGEVKFCRYCPARPICKQAEDYTAQGLLTE